MANPDDGFQNTQLTVGMMSSTAADNDSIGSDRSDVAHNGSIGSEVSLPQTVWNVEAEEYVLFAQQQPACVDPVPLLATTPGIVGQCVLLPAQASAPAPAHLSVTDNEDGTHGEDSAVKDPSPKEKAQPSASLAEGSRKRAEAQQYSPSVAISRVGQCVHAQAQASSPAPAHHFEMVDEYGTHCDDLAHIKLKIHDCTISALRTRAFIAQEQIMLGGKYNSLMMQYFSMSVQG